MSLEQLLDLIVDVESRFPVERWQVGSVRVWPLVRNQLWWQIDHSVTVDQDLASPGGTAHPALAGLRSHLAHASGYTRANLVDFRRSASLRTRADAVCLAYSSSRELIAGQWYERFYDPLEPALTSLGLRSLHLELQHRYRVPRHAPSRFVQVPLDLRHTARRRLSARHPVMGLAEYPAFLEHLRRLGIDDGPLQPELLAVQMMLLETSARYFEAILGKVGARVGFLEDFGLVPMAFILACRRRGIPSVELQHGVQGPLHFAYSRWTRLPPDGYELLPAVYWTWTSFEAATIGEWTRGRERWHRAVVGGNLFVTEWRRRTSELPGDNGRSGSLSEAGADGVRVLVTLQKGIGGEQLAPLAGAIRAAAGRIRWWVRMHPAMDQAEARRAVSMLDPGDGSVEVERATSLPLFSLLGHADVHVTFHSSVVLEAEQFGVPSVAFSRDAAALYPVEVATGWLLCVDRPEELLPAIRAQAGRAGDLSRGTVEAALPVDTVRRILGTDGPWAP